jgi:hypothetical protein
MRPTLFIIELSCPGRLCTMARPRGGDWLADDLRCLHQAGIDVLVSLLSDEEVAELSLGAEAETAAAVGVAFHRLSTRDRQVPDRVATLKLATSLRELLHQGAGIAVHCRYGIGRAYTLAAAVLLLDGLAPAEIWNRIAAARGLPVPDTVSQREFIDSLLLHR